MGVVGIVLSLVPLMLLAYRGVSMIVLATLAALFAACFDADAPLLASYTQVFMPALGRFIAACFPLFLLPPQQNLWVILGSGNRPST